MHSLSFFRRAGSRSPIRQCAFSSPTIAVTHVRWTMEGARPPPGGPEPREGIQIQVLQKTKGHWLIVSLQNTNGIPERPFPMGPPTATSNP